MIVSLLSPLVGPAVYVPVLSCERLAILFCASTCFSLSAAGTPTGGVRTAKTAAAAANTPHSTHGSHQRPTGCAAGRSWMRKERTRSLSDTGRPGKLERDGASG